MNFYEDGIKRPVQIKTSWKFEEDLNVELINVERLV